MAQDSECNRINTKYVSLNCYGYICMSKRYKLRVNDTREQRSGIEFMIKIKKPKLWIAPREQCHRDFIARFQPLV